MGASVTRTPLSRERTANCGPGGEESYHGPPAVPALDTSDVLELLVANPCRARPGPTASSMDFALRSIVKIGGLSARVLARLRGPLVAYCRANLTIERRGRK